MCFAAFARAKCAHIKDRTFLIRMSHQISVCAQGSVCMYMCVGRSSETFIKALVCVCVRQRQREGHYVRQSKKKKKKTALWLSNDILKASQQKTEKVL